MIGNRWWTKFVPWMDIHDFSYLPILTTSSKLDSTNLSSLWMQASIPTTPLLSSTIVFLYMYFFRVHSLMPSYYARNCWSLHGTCMHTEHTESWVKEMLRDLWSSVVEPVATTLQNDIQLPPGSRIWWCPTSKFTTLPLHAAGSYQKVRCREPYGPPRFLLRTFSFRSYSYVPTVKGP